MNGNGNEEAIKTYPTQVKIHPRSEVITQEQLILLILTLNTYLSLK